MWVRSEYAGELAVLSTWLAGLLPWSVTLFSEGGITAVTIRFLPFRFLYVLGVSLPGERPFLFVWQVPGFVASDGVTLASRAWLVGAAAFLLPFGLSVAYYLREEAVEARLDPVRALGGLLVLVGLVLAAAFALLWRHQAGLNVPVGVPVLLVLGAVLLRTERL